MIDLPMDGEHGLTGIVKEIVQLGYPELSDEEFLAEFKDLEEEFTDYETSGEGYSDSFHDQ